MTKIIRRDVLRLATASLAIPILASESKASEKQTAQATAMKIHYLEIVTREVDAICQTYEQLHGMVFGKPDMDLGNARTAKRPDGSLLAVRAPLRPTEKPIVRPYFLVEDINVAVTQAEDAGAVIALPPMKLPGHGQCAIFIQGGVEHGLWQL